MPSTSGAESETERGARNRDFEVLDADAVRTVVDTAPDGILVAGEDGTILFANRQAGVLFGFEPDGLLGRSVDELLPERLRGVHRAHRTRYRAEPRLRSMGAGSTLFGRHADGTEFPVEISLSPLSSEQGMRVVAVVRDVSERVQAEERQREVREALDATRDAVLVLDAETLQFTYANQGAVDQVGYTRDELLQMTMLHIAPEFSRRRLDELLEPMTTGERSSIMFRTTHRHRDGTDIPVEILMQAIRDDEGIPVRYVKIVRDVRERLEAEERIRRAEQHLRIVEDRERIARDLHDIVIQKVFAAGMALQSVAARSVDADEARRLNGVVDDLDDTIREIRSAIFSLQSDAHDSVGLRADVLGILDEERAALGFEPRVRFGGAVDTTAPAVAAELLAALREALSNVARHALASSVDVDVEYADGLLTLRVRDDGRGLPADVSAGNGLGNLTGRAEKLGGHCCVGDRPGGGSELEWQVPA
jgi:PAS domain S-box-containing protein